MRNQNKKIICRIKNNQKWLFLAIFLQKLADFLKILKMQLRIQEYDLVGNFGS